LSLGAPRPGLADTREVQRVEPEDAPARGPRHAPVTVEFFCGASFYGCREHHILLTELARRHPQRLRVVYRFLQRPGPKEGNPFAEAAMEAWAQGRFFEYVDALHGSRVSPRRDLDRIARQAGLDLERLKTALADGRHRPRLEASDVWAARLNVSEHVSSALVWNGKAITPRANIEEYEKAYDEMYLDARRLLEVEGVSLRRLYPTLLRRAARLQAEAYRRYPGHGPFAEDVVDLLATRANVPQDGAPARGDATARVTIVIFADFQCPGCYQLQRDLRRLDDAYPGLVRIVYKHFPLLVHADARLAAEAAACANDQGKFWPFHDRLYAAYQRIKRADLVRYAAEVGLDVDQLLEDLDAGRCAERVRVDVSDGKALNVEQTPTLFVNGLKVPANRAGFADLRALLDEELRPGLLESVSPDPR